jgi:hypothetical protein
MVRRIAAALVAMGIFLASPVAPAIAKQSCGPGMHVTKKGKCVANGKHAGRPCPANTHRGAHGHCQPN